MAPLPLVKVREWMDGQSQPDIMSRRRSKKAQCGCPRNLEQARTVFPPLPCLLRQASKRSLPFVAVRNPSASGILPSPQRTHRPSDGSLGRRLATVLIPPVPGCPIPLSRSLCLPPPLSPSVVPPHPQAAASPSDENASILTRLRPTALRHPRSRSLGQNYCKARSDIPSRPSAPALELGPRHKVIYIDRKPCI